MRRAALLVVLAACSAKAPEPVKIAASKPPASASVVDAGAPAAPVVAAPAPEAPLAWGTRPSAAGPLYPLVDGMCIHMEVWPFDDGSAYLTYGNVGGGYNRGSLTPTGVHVGDDGLELGGKPYSPLNPVWMGGSWNGLVVSYTNLPSRVGMGDYAVETHDANGWKTLASRTDPDMNAPPPPGYERTYYARPVLFQGHVVFAKGTERAGGVYALHYEAVPPLAGIAKLDSSVRTELQHDLVASADTLYALYSDEQKGEVIRAWKDGQLRDVSPPGAGPQSLVRARILATTPNLVVKTDKVRELVNGTWQETPLPAGEFGNPETAPNGDLWVRGEKNTVLVLRMGESGRHTRLDRFTLPPAATPRPRNRGEWSSVAGGDLAGVPFDDVYAVNDAGVLFHHDGVGDAWKEVPFPKPPFAIAPYHADSIAMKTKGDLFVNASYGEKGEGWKTAERYRAILRTKRPKETFRCNEPNYGYEVGAGSGFMSFPPLADDSCATPFVVILRTYYAKTSDSYFDQERKIYDAKSDFPSVRASIKATPSLGETVELVDLRSGNQGYLGAPVPSVAAGHEFIKELAKRVVVLPELRPELVCGTPDKVVSRRRVEVATGAWSSH